MMLSRAPLPHPRAAVEPDWARSVAAAVVGSRWPTGDEAATWDIADRWYELADTLSGPRATAFRAADQIVAGLLEAGIAPDGFREAWDGLSIDEDAPLNALVQIAAELGQLVEECGREIEAAKLAMWLEVATVLTELAGLQVANELTLGAASLAGEGLVAASRIAVEQIFEQLVEQVGGTAPNMAGATPEEDAAITGRHKIRMTRELVPVDGSVGLAAGVTRRRDRETPVADTPDGGTRRSSTGSIAEIGIMTRRLAPLRPTGGHRHSGHRDFGAVTRRPDPTDRWAADRPAVGRPTIPMQRAPGRHDRDVEQLRRAEYADLLSTVAEGIRTQLAAAGTSAGRALRAYADEVETEAALLRSRPRNPSPTPAPEWARGDPPPDGWAAGARTRDGRPEGDRAGREGAENHDAPGAQTMSERAPRKRARRSSARDDRTPRDRVNDDRVQDDRADRDRSPSDRSGGEETAEGTAHDWSYGDPVPATAVQPPGGLRAAHRVPRKALADAVPRAGDGRPDRLPDPRLGRWFSLLNAAGPGDDPTRGLNCLDAVLALFETYQRGRPRVAAARTFDGYAHGQPDRPVGGEWSGVRRIQQATRSEFQNLCPFVGGAELGPARAAVDAALRNLANHLHNSGHGAFAFILTDFETGGCHAWAAVNQGGTILYLDPQLGRVAVEEPLYRHHAEPGDANVVSMDALVVDGDGNPAPLPYHGAGQWTAQAILEGAS